MIDVAVALILVLVAFAVSRSRRLELEKELSVAVVRAIAQLVAVAAVIDVVLAHFGLAGVLLAAMLVIAGWTSARRMKGVPRAFVLAVTVIGFSSGVALLVLFVGGAFDFRPRFLVPIGGMLIGNTMATVSLAGARLRDEFVDKTSEIEARLALGVGARTALNPYARRATLNALIPLIDATKNAGVILLPGAFLGIILAGGSPGEAARVQLIVLFMLLGAVALAAIFITELVSRAFIGPGERVVVPSDIAR
jgi:putative ABC transport system permease protein